MADWRLCAETGRVNHSDTLNLEIQYRAVLFCSVCMSHYSMFSFIQYCNIQVHLLLVLLCCSLSYLSFINNSQRGPFIALFLFVSPIYRIFCALHFYFLSHFHHHSSYSCVTGAVRRFLLIPRDTIEHLTHSALEDGDERSMLQLFFSCLFPLSY